MLNNDALLTLGVAEGSGEGSTSTVGAGARVRGEGRTGVQAGWVVCRVCTWRAVEGRYVVNAEGFWGGRGIFRSAFTRGMRRVAFSCKRGKGRGPRDRPQRAMGTEPTGHRLGKGQDMAWSEATEGVRGSSSGMVRRSSMLRSEATEGVRGSSSGILKQETESRSKDLNSVSAVRTRLELATPGVTGRYSKPTELPHQLSVNFPFGIAKVQLKFDSANILKEFNEKNVRPRRVGHFQRVCGRGRSLEREGCRTSKGRFAGPRGEGHRTLGKRFTGPRSGDGPFRVPPS